MLMKKITAIFAVSALACCAFTGCGTSGGGSGSSSDRESSAVEESNKEESSKEESIEEESSEVKNEPEEVNEVLYSDDTVRITYTGIDTEDWMGEGLKVTIENLSDKNITVQTNETSVNGIMEEPYFSCDVAAGKTANDSITFSIDDKIGVVELSFHIFDTDTWDAIVDTDVITVTVDDSISVEKADATVIYDANGITVSYVGVNIDEIWGTEFDFIVENNGEETFTVHADNVSIDGVMHDGSLYAEVAAGKYANESMSFIGDDLPEEMSELEFTIRITNSNYETVAESDPIKVAIN